MNSSSVPGVATDVDANNPTSKPPQTPPDTNHQQSLDSHSHTSSKDGTALAAGDATEDNNRASNQHFASTATGLRPEPGDPKFPSTSLLHTFSEMVTELLEARELLWQLTVRDLRVRYKQAIMGLGWALLMPLLIVGAGILIKYAASQMAGRDIALASLGGITVKGLAWAFFVGSINFATPSLVASRGLVTKIYFPREVLPLAAVQTQLFDSCIGGVTAVLVLLLMGSIAWSFSLLWIVPLLILLVLLTAGLALFLSCANLFFRDVKYLVQIMVTFGIFFTPVLFEPVNFGPTGAMLMMANPLSPILEGLRLSIVEGHNLFFPLTKTVHDVAILEWSPLFLVYSAAWALLGLLGAWWLFHKLEFVYAEYA